MRRRHILAGSLAFAALGLAFPRRSVALIAEYWNPIRLDLNMPRMDGREFLTRLRADDRFKTIPGVVLTTSTTERDVEMSYGLGANSFITKPVDVDQMFQAIRIVSDYWFSVVRLPATS